MLIQTHFLRGILSHMPQSITYNKCIKKDWRCHYGTDVEHKSLFLLYTHSHNTKCNVKPQLKNWKKIWIFKCTSQDTVLSFLSWFTFTIIFFFFVGRFEIRKLMSPLKLILICLFFGPTFIKNHRFQVTQFQLKDF